MTERLRNLSEVMKPDPRVKIHVRSFVIIRSLPSAIVSSRSVITGTEQRLESDPKQKMGSICQVGEQNLTFLLQARHLTPLFCTWRLDVGPGWWQLSRMGVLRNTWCVQGTWASFTFGPHMKYCVLMDTLVINSHHSVKWKALEVSAKFVKENSSQPAWRGKDGLETKPAPKTFASREAVEEEIVLFFFFLKEKTPLQTPQVDIHWTMFVYFFSFSSKILLKMTGKKTPIKIWADP